MAQPTKPSAPRGRGIGMLRGTVPWMLLTFLVAQGLNAAFSAIPGAVETLRGWNAALLHGLQRLQPWSFAALYWGKITSNWPELSPLQVPFFLLGRVIGAGLEVILSTMADPATAAPALVGYGLGFAFTWLLFADSRDELNPYIAVPGTILLGGCALAILQPVLVLGSVVSERLLGAAAGGVATLASVGTPLFWELAKHVVQNRTEKAIETEIERRTPEQSADGPGEQGAVPGKVVPGRTAPTDRPAAPTSRLATRLAVAGLGLILLGAILAITGLYDRFPVLGIGATVAAFILFGVSAWVDRRARDPGSQPGDERAPAPDPGDPAATEG